MSFGNMSYEGFKYFSDRLYFRSFAGDVSRTGLYKSDRLADFEIGMHDQHSFH